MWVRVFDPDRPGKARLPREPYLGSNRKFPPWAGTAVMLTLQYRIPILQTQEPYIAIPDVGESKT
jgi:hypothetical protein